MRFSVNWFLLFSFPSSSSPLPQPRRWWWWSGRSSKKSELHYFALSPCEVWTFVNRLSVALIASITFLHITLILVQSTQISNCVYAKGIEITRFSHAISSSYTQTQIQYFVSFIQLHGSKQGEKKKEKINQAIVSQGHKPDIFVGKGARFAIENRFL